MAPNEIIDKLREDAIEIDALWTKKNALQIAANEVGREIEAIDMADRELWKQLQLQARSRQ